MKKFYLILMALAAFTANAQVRIATDQGAAHSKSMLEINSTDKGLLIPRLTTAQRTAITATADATADGLLVYDTDLKALYVYSGAAWNAIPNTASISSSSTIAPVISSANGANAILGFNVVDGSISSGKLADGAVTATKLASMSATSGQVLTYNGTAWAPATPAAGGGGGGVDANVKILGKDAGNGGSGNSIAFTTPGSTTFSSASFDPTNATGNVAIGQNALAAITSGLSNLAIGANAGDATTTGSSNIFIGAGANNDDPAESNVINIGNRIKVGSYATDDWALGLGLAPSTPAGNTVRLQTSDDIKVGGNVEAGSLKLKTSGVAQLSAGTVSVSVPSGIRLQTGNTSKTAILLSSNVSTVTGILRAEFANNATTFTIRSSSATDTGNVAWMIVIQP